MVCVYMNIDSETINELCNNTDILDYLLAQSEEVRKVGKYYYCTCCNTDEHTPSLCIYPETNSFYCYSCHQGGNILQYFRNHEGLPFKEALDKLCRLNNITDSSSLIVPENILALRNIKKKLTKIVEEDFSYNILDFEKDYLNVYKDDIPVEWVEEGISPEIMKEFDIRIDDKSNRIVYPVWSNDDEFIGVKGRSRYNDELLKQMKIPKYMNYQKLDSVRYFGGMKYNRQNILDANKIILVEGIKTVMHLSQWGYNYCVSTETSAINKYQLEILLKLGVKEVIIGYDTDVPIAQIKKNIKMLSHFTNVSVIRDRDFYGSKILGMPDDKLSPCDKGREVFETLYNERKGVA